MTHTPGPWHWSDDGEGNKWGRKGLEPCVLYGTVEGLVSVYDGDALLMAASPDLLAALQAVWAFFEPVYVSAMADDTERTAQDELMDTVRAAIAEATGEA